MKVKDGTYKMQLLSATTTVSYNINPSNIDMSKIDAENLMVTSHVAKMYTRAGGVEDAVENNPFTAKFVEIKNGKLNVSLDIDYAAFEKAYSKDFSLDQYFTGLVGNGSESPVGEKNIVLALQVPHSAEAKKEGVATPYVTSDYTLAVVKPIYGIDIARKDVAECLRYSDLVDGPGADDKTKNVPNKTDIDWAGVENAKILGDGINKYNNVLKPKDARVVDLVEGESLDLHTVVKAVAGSERFPASVNDCRTVDVEKYDNFEKVEGLGNVELIKDVADGQTTYLPKWTVSSCDMYAAFIDKCKKTASSATLTATGRFFNAKGDEVIVKFSVLAKLADNMNLKPADLYQKYWHANYTYIEHHSQKPRTANDADVANFTYTTDINGAFVNTMTTPSAFKNMEYEYVFAPAAEQISGVKDKAGKAIVITVSADNKQLLANGVVVITIKDHNALNAGSGDLTDPKSSDLLTYEKNDMANYLLNKSNNGRNYFMWARLQIKAVCNCSTAPASFVKINGNDGFNVRFLRPLDVNSTSTEKFIDGVDQGKKGSIVDIFKAVGLADWRKDSFKDNPNYYDFYGVTAITYEGGARWDANGTVEAIPTTVELSWKDRAALEVLTGGDLNFDGVANGSDNDPELFRAGGLVYDSNESVVKEDYYLYVPITITYDRGVIVTREIKILVEKTTTRAGK